MNTCILRPPTSRVLSDSVITSVVQRKNGFGDHQHSYENTHELQWPRTFTTKQVPSTMGQYSSSAFASRQYSPTTVSFGSTLPLDSKRERQEAASPVASKSMRLDVSNSDATKRSAQEALNQVATQNWFIEQEMRRREIRRMRQIRYRKKQQDYMVALDEGNRRLRLEVAKLEQRRRAIATAIPTEKTLWNVVVEYFRLFRFGLRTSELIERSSSSPVCKSSAQLDFLHATMAPDVLYNAGRGVEAIMRNWKYFSIWFQDVEVDLDGVRRSGAGALVATTTTTFSISEQTLVNVFPHLCGKDADDTERRLATMLLGKTIVMRGSTRFESDTAYGRVTSVTSESDMLTPMLSLLGSLEAVSQVFDKSLISLTPYRFCSYEDE